MQKIMQPGSGLSQFTVGFALLGESSAAADLLGGGAQAVMLDMTGGACDGTQMNLYSLSGCTLPAQHFSMILELGALIRNTTHIYTKNGRDLILVL